MDPIFGNMIYEPTYRTYKDYNDPMLSLDVDETSRRHFVKLFRMDIATARELIDDLFPVDPNDGYVGRGRFMSREMIVLAGVGRF